MDKQRLMELAGVPLKEGEGNWIVVEFDRYNAVDSIVNRRSGNPVKILADVLDLDIEEYQELAQDHPDMQLKPGRNGLLGMDMEEVSILFVPV